MRGITAIIGLSFVILISANTAIADVRVDSDDMIICSIVFGKVSELYSEKSDYEKSQSFASTSLAYSHVGEGILTRAYSGQDVTQYVDQRMLTLTESLNHSSINNPLGDLGVIDSWLSYCDSLGPSVQYHMDKWDDEE